MSQAAFEYHEERQKHIVQETKRDNENKPEAKKKEKA